MTIWRDIPVRILTKDIHIHHIGGRRCGCIHFDAGSVPIGNWNGITGQFEPVVNNRGRAYAKRNHIPYRTNKKKLDN